MIDEIIAIIIMFFFVFLFWENALVVTLAFVAVTIVLLFIEYDRKAVYFFVIGLILGTIIEFIAVNVIRFEHYMKPTFFGIPLFMPFLWAFAFFIIWRIEKDL